jgi:hypothetical protein
MTAQTGVHLNTFLIDWEVCVSQFLPRTSAEWTYSFYKAFMASLYISFPHWLSVYELFGAMRTLQYQGLGGNYMDQMFF